MDFFRKNLLQKIIAFVVAVGCWFYVMNDQNPPIENTFTVPVTVLNLPSGYTVVKDIDEAKITIKAQRTLFSSLDISTIKIFVDLNHIDTGNHEVPLQTVLPNGFEIISLDPGKINVYVEKIEEKTVPVKLNISGNPANGNVVAKTSLSMQNVKVQGPFSIINKVTSVIGYLNVTDAKEDNSYSVSLIAVDDKNKEIQGVKILPNSVDVEVSLARGLNKKIVDVKPNVMGDLSDEYILKSYSIDPDKIEISGQDNVLSNISYISTMPISLSDIKKPTTIKATLDVPKEISAPDVVVKIYIDVENKDISNKNKEKKNN